MENELDNNILQLPLEEYKNNLFPINEYFKQASYYVSKRKKIPLEQAEALVKDVIKTFKILNPNVKYIGKENNGDSTIKTEKLSEYISNVIKDKEVIVPSFTTYYHPDRQKSIHSEYMFTNVKRRSKFKKEAFRNKQDGDLDKAGYNDTMQKSMKIFNNSMSGAYASKSTVLHNPSAHYTLTSITRCVSSIGNAMSESFLAGNKHFKSATIVYNYITAIISNVRKETIELTLDRYKLYKPTPNDVLEMIKHNSKSYWDDENTYEDILNYLNTLEPYELASIMYVNDFWNLRKYNELFIRNMLTNVSRKVNNITSNPIYIKEAPESIEILTKIICAEDIKGKNIDYDKIENTELGFILCSTCYNILRELKKYKLLLKSFYLTDILPINIADIKEMMRDVIVLSDTDSTCASYDKWVEWYFGEPTFSQEAISIAAVVMTLNGSIIDHGLKILSKNMNITGDRAELLKMKNEFYWLVFTVTNVNKHYFAQTLIQEGNVYKEPELELKGVHLIASAVDQSITKRIHNMIKDINNTITKGERINIRKYIDYIKSIEKEIIERIDKGDISIYKKDKIKEEKAYKQEAKLSPYLHHILWEEIFSSKYGEAGKPTYMVVKIPTILDSKKKVKEFIENIQDDNIKNRFSVFMEKYNKDSLGTFRPPLSIVSNRGVPEEIIPVIDKERIVKDNLNSAYMVLEAIGYYRKHDKLLTQL